MNQNRQTAVGNDGSYVVKKDKTKTQPFRKMQGLSFFYANF